MKVLSFNKTVHWRLGLEMIQLLQQHHSFIPNSPHMNPVDYKIWGVKKEEKKAGQQC